ncbi:GNAT family N-acetyltransferase [Alphaproteobacteria bacterium]|jgi:ribosomal protein S18 acetylase RimI-like enzyme|nr:GNAT family N-acetyltransferase [Alphaproteobacteria bacterium]
MQKNKEFNVKAELCTNLSKVDLQELCEATEEAILAGGGFGWVFPPANKTLQDYWKGVLLIPERVLIVGKLDNIVAGSVQLIKPTKNNEAQSHSCVLSTFFFASWARGFGLAKAVFQKAESKAIEDGFKVITLEVRETQLRAIQLYEQAGFIKFGMNPKAALVNGKYIAGYHYYKELL